MNKINTQAFQIIHPEALYHPKSNGYSHIAVVKPNMRIIHLAGQGGENKNGELSPFFDQQVQQVFYNIQQALASIQATLSDIAVLRVLIVDHDAQKHQLVIKTIVDLWKTHEFPVCTLIPVTGLALPEMQIEIEATAYTA